MRKSIPTIFIALIAMMVSLMECFAGCAERPVAKKKENTISVLGKVPSDLEDPTMALRMVGQKGFLIRTWSIWTSEDQGRIWHKAGTAQRGSTPGSFEALWIKDRGHILATSGKTVLESINDGRNWVKKFRTSDVKRDFLAISGDEESSWVLIGGAQSVPVPPGQLGTLPKYANDVSSTSRAPRMLVPAIMISRDHGDTWRSAHLPASVGTIDTIVVSGRIAMALGPYVVFSSTDSGKSWSALRLEPWMEKEEAYPVAATISGNRWWVSLKNGTLLSGTPGKQELSQVAQSTGPLEGLIFLNRCVGFALREDDLVKTTDGGHTWMPLTHSRNVKALYVTQSRAFVATHDQILQVEVDPAEDTGACAK